LLMYSPSLPHVSANVCHLQGVVVALEAIQAVSVWAYTGYDLSSVASCRGMYPRLVAGTCECGNKPSGSIQCGEFLD
jgi:hypothetical protein